jgi:peptidoglycan hydrolase-like protein with peptidoglycan-binding domain
MANNYLKLGSQGDYVKKVQKNLNLKGGYGLAEDGILGDKTLFAIKDYQGKQGLDTDGIVGPETWALLMDGYDNPFLTTSNPSSGGGTSSNNAPNGGSANKGFTYNDFSYNDYKESDVVAQAKQALEAQLAQKPGAYQSPFQAQLDEAMKKILNREKFSYDFNEDAFYQQYKDKFIKQGKMAMQDTMGQASAMTGGYGNSYAQSVGQQAYNAQLENLNDVIPELYQMALDKYQMEGQDLYNQYAMLGDRENLEYGRYRDSVADWNTERDYLTGRHDSEREYDYNKYANERDFAYGQYGDDKAYAYQDYRNKIEDQQWQAQFDEAKRQYDEQMAIKNGTSNNVSNTINGNKTPTKPSNNSTGNNNSKPNYNNGSLTDSQIKELQNALGVTADGKWGTQSSQAAEGLSADAAWKAYQKGLLGGKKSNTSFTGKTADDAINYMVSKGVPSNKARQVMTPHEWNSRRSSYQTTGKGTAESKNYSSYAEYLADYVEYATQTYGLHTKK